MKKSAILQSIALAIILATGGNIACNASTSEAPQSVATARPAALAQVFKNAVSEYPFDIKLFDNPTLKQRMIKLLGKQRCDFLIKNFDVQTPIEYHNNAYSTFACQAHNCGTTEFEILYFPFDDNLCIRYRVDDAESIFMEKNTKITWPNKL